MTAIWDTLGGKAVTLAEREFDEKKAGKLKTAMTAIHNVIKDRPEYQSLSTFLGRKPLIQTLEQVVKEPNWTKATCQTVYEIVESLHDFDHKDLPLGRKKCFGHRTEILLTRNKEYTKLLRNISYNSWWDGLDQ